VLKRRADAEDTGPDFETRELVRARFWNRCARCGWYGGGNIHHRRPRGLGGSHISRDDDPENYTNCPSNLLWLCGSGTTGCHGWVESHRAAARDAGWLVGHGITPPAAVPVTLWDGQRVLLDAEGGWRLAPILNPTPGG
jgi:hypothetical protein